MTVPVPVSPVTAAAVKVAPAASASASRSSVTSSSSSSSAGTGTVTVPAGSSNSNSSASHNGGNLPESPPVGPTSPHSHSHPSHQPPPPHQPQQQPPLPTTATTTGGGGPPFHHQPRGRLVSRACDRCRRRKAKCEYLSAVDSCTHCRDAHVQCTFDLPLARRGPKARKRSDAATQPAPDSTTISAARGGPPLPQQQQQQQQQQGLGGFPGTGPATGLPFANNSSLSPDAAWDAGDPMGIDTEITRQPLESNNLSSQNMSTRQRWANLSHAVSNRNQSLERIIRRCVDLFFEYLYPLTPLLYEPAIREVVNQIFSQFSSGMNEASPHAQMSPGASAGTPSSMSESWHNMGHTNGSNMRSNNRLAPGADSTFILVTAVCAEASFMLPKEIFPEGESVADLFLQASRDGLHQHLESDLESPTANSITIRYFHSNCLHAVGKPKYSWHIFGEAIRLAQVMHLHDESSMNNLYPIEAELRRRCFWILYLGDKSAAILNNRPITIHKYCFDSGISTQYPSGIEAESAGLSPGDNNSDLPRRSFIAGFNANVRLWQSAADLLLETRLLQDQAQQNYRPNVSPDSILTSTERQNLESLYIRFITCLDDLPPYLQSFSMASSSGVGIPLSEAKQFVIQTTNLQVTLHCLRMVIEQKFEELSYYPPGAEVADLRKSEIVRDMLRVMHEAPFWALQANGEPNVEKIRLIGASLLAIIHRNQDSPLAARARSDFTVLLDILTRLDSKASDALRSDSNTVA